MQKAVPVGQGALLAVLGAEDSVIEQICTDASTDNELIAIANYNSTGQSVVGGAKAAVDRFVTLAKEQNIKKLVELPVSVPSHTPLMQSAAHEFAADIEAVHLAEPKCGIVQNVSASMPNDVDELRENLVRQLYKPVLWKQSILGLAQSGVLSFIECGPGKVLAGLSRRIDKSITTVSATAEITTDNQ